jgi:hypothetical protein
MHLRPFTTPRLTLLFESHHAHPSIFCQSLGMRRALEFCLLAVLICFGLTMVRAQKLEADLPDAPLAVSGPIPIGQDGPGQVADNKQAFGTVSGSVTDAQGNAVAAALVTLAVAGKPLQQVATDDQGRFAFGSVAAGGFRLTVNALGFANQTKAGVLQPGEVATLPAIALVPASAVSDVQVTVTREQLAEEEIQGEEKQRIFGVLANFYVTYDRHPLPLTPRQKFELAWKTAFDPVGFIITGVVAGAQQANDSYSGYGQGAQGYAKRYGADYADGFIGNIIGNAILPVVFKQDPRYYWKGTGTTRSRILYALANAVVRKGDNGKWQPDYSGILGGLAAGGIANLYYPAANRDGVGLTFENVGIGTGATAAANLFQEFLIRHLTPGTSKSSGP